MEKREIHVLEAPEPTGRGKATGRRAWSDDTVSINTARR